MRGSMLPVWPRTWHELWSPLAQHSSAPADLFCELYRALMPALKTPPSLAVLAEIIDDPPQSLRTFRQITADDLIDELALLGFLQNAYDVLDELAGEALANAYFNRLTNFINIYNLRYELRRPCGLYPTMPGLFANLVQGCATATPSTHTTTSGNETSTKRFVICMTRAAKAVSKPAYKNRSTCWKTWVATILGSMNTRCRVSVISSPHWPHAKVRNALKSLYGFTCDYPAIRHGGNPGSVEGNIEMRCMLALCILFTGFTPYLTDRLDVAAIFQGR